MLNWIVFVYIFGIVRLSDTVIPSHYPKWLPFRDTAYYIQFQWASSYFKRENMVYICNGRGGKVVGPSDPDVIEWIKDTIFPPPFLQQPYRFHLQVNFDFNKKEYMFEDGTVLAKNDPRWAPGHPKGGYKADVVVMGDKHSYDPDFPFYSVHRRDSRAHYVCSKPYVPPSSTTLGFTGATTQVQTTTPEATTLDVTSEEATTEPDTSPGIDVFVEKDSFPIALVAGAAGGGGGALILFVIILVVVLKRRQAALAKKKRAETKAEKKRKILLTLKEGYDEDDDDEEEGASASSNRATKSSQPRRSTLYFGARTAYQKGRASLLSIFSKYVDADTSRRNLPE